MISIQYIIMHFMLGQTNSKVLTNPRYRDKITTNDLQKTLLNC